MTIDKERIPAKFVFPRLSVVCVHGDRIMCHAPKPLPQGHYPTYHLGQTPVANAPEGSLLFLFRRYVDNAMVVIYAPNN